MPSSASDKGFRSFVLPPTHVTPEGFPFAQLDHPSGQKKLLSGNFPESDKAFDDPLSFE